MNHQAGSGFDASVLNDKKLFWRKSWSTPSLGIKYRTFLKQKTALEYIFCLKIAQYLQICAYIGIIRNFNFGGKSRLPSKNFYKMDHWSNLRTAAIDKATMMKQTDTNIASSITNARQCDEMLEWKVAKLFPKVALWVATAIFT